MEHLGGSLQEGGRLLDDVGIPVTDREAHRANCGQEVLLTLALALAECNLLDFTETIVSELPRLRK